MSLLSQLPAPSQRIVDAQIELISGSSRAIVTRSSVPPYGHRKNWFPRTEEDFGDGGAFPEIHMPQYPLGMGKQKSASNALVMKTDKDGKVRYDELIRGGHSKDRIIYSKYSDLLPKPIEEDDEELQKPAKEVIEEITEKTRKALEAVVEQKVAASLPVRAAGRVGPAEYISYTPAQQGPAYNSGARQRLVRMVEAQHDPMEPPRFKINQKIPRGPPSPPPPLMHSPSRKVTAKEQAEWKIPPCISNWKNPRGYTIPLDKRVAADGRGLQTMHINENFAKLAESLYTAERKAREAVEVRAQIERKVASKVRERKEEQLQKIAMEARAARAGIRARGGTAPETAEEVASRDELRRERARDRAHERNVSRASGGKVRTARDRERDISEQIALGLPNPRAASGASSEAMFDQRLFNQSRGMDSGFAGGADDLYNIYDQPWRAEANLGSHLYRPSKQVLADSEMGGESLESAMGRQRQFVAERGFAGAERGTAAHREGPVQFERAAEDPFNVSTFLLEAKKADKRPAADQITSRDSLRKRNRRD